jgi:hypothetical protein
MVVVDHRGPRGVRIVAGTRPRYGDGLRPGHYGHRLPAVLLHWRDEDGLSRRHAPDFFARRADGSGLVVDVRPDDRIPARDAGVFRITAMACRQAGWGFRRAGAIDPVVRANIRWLSRYRHQRCRIEPAAAQLLEAFAPGRPLLAGVSQVGDPVAVLPAAYHLLWCRELACDMSALLGSSSMAWRVPAGASR